MQDRSSKQSLGSRFHCSLQQASQLRTPEKPPKHMNSNTESLKEWDDPLSTVKILQKRLRPHDKDLLTGELPLRKSLKTEGEETSRGSAVKDFSAIEEESTAANSNSLHSLGSIPSNEDGGSRKSAFSKLILEGRAEGPFPFTSFKNLRNNLSNNSNDRPSTQKISSLIGSPLSIFKPGSCGTPGAKKSPRALAYSPRSPFRLLENLTRTPKKTNSPAGAAKQSEAEIKASNILQKAPLRERYRKLFEDEQEEVRAMLPMEYAHLKKLFEQLDLLISYLNNRKQAATFETVSGTLERNNKLKLTLKHLSKMLYTYPGSYNLVWDKNANNSNKLELFISLGEEKAISERLREFESRLKLLTRKHHIRFAESLDCQDPLKEEILNRDGEAPFHPRFDLDTAPEIPAPLELIPEKPYKEKVQTIKEFLQNQNPLSAETNRLLADVMQTSARRLEGPALDLSLLNKECSTRLARSASLGLSDNLVQMMRQKELEKQKSQEELKRKAGLNLKSRLKMKKVAEIVKMHFDMRNCSNMFWTNVVDHVSLVNSSLIIGKAEISEVLESLIKVCPHWIRSVANREGRILRIDKMLPINVVVKAIDDCEEAL